MIESFQRWTFSEFVLDDGAGVITRWIETLDDEVQAQIDTKLLHWRKVDKWITAWAGKFEDLKDIQEIVVYSGKSVYRILGTQFSIWEFVMLVPYKDENKRSNVPPEIRALAEDRLNQLRADPEKRREFTID